MKSLYAKETYLRIPSAYAVSVKKILILEWPTICHLRSLDSFVYRTVICIVYSGMVRFEARETLSKLMFE